MKTLRETISWDKEESATLSGKLIQFFYYSSTQLKKHDFICDG